MVYGEWEIKETESEWCKVFKNGVFKAHTVNMEEGRRYIWLQLKGTPKEVEYLTEDMFKNA